MRGGEHQGEWGCCEPINIKAKKNQESGAAKL